MKIAVQLGLTVVAGVLLGAGALVSPGPGRSEPTDPPAATTPAEPKEHAIPASIEDLAFLYGAWRGDTGEGVAEEVWSPASSAGLVGCFRWLKKDGTPAMFELLAITREEGVTRLRLRHFSPVLVAKEQVDKPLTLRLTDHGKGKARFIAEKDAGDLDRVTYELTDSKLHVTVEFIKGEKAREPLKFVMTRQAN